MSEGLNGENTLPEEEKVIENAEANTEPANENKDIRSLLEKNYVSDDKPKEEVVVAPVKDEPTIIEDKRPSSWKKDYDEDWKNLTPKVKQYILQRESEAAAGVSKYKQDFDSVSSIKKSLDPFMPYMQKNGYTPETWLTALGQAEMMLRNGTPEAKIQMFNKLASDYGVDLGALTGQGQGNPQVSHLLQQMNILKQNFQNIEQNNKEVQYNEAVKAVELFKQDKPHFDDVRELMAQLIDSGVAEDLQGAYDKAIRIDDTVWGKVQAQQVSDNLAKQKANLGQKKAKAVSPATYSPTAVGTGNTSKENVSIRQALEQAYIEE